MHVNVCVCLGRRVTVNTMWKSNVQPHISKLVTIFGFEGGKIAVIEIKIYTISSSDWV